MILLIDKIDFEIKEKIKKFPLISRVDNLNEIFKSSLYTIVSIDTNNKNVVGYILINPSSHKLSAEIYFLEVLPKYQNKGIGAALLKRALFFLNKNKEKQVSLLPIPGNEMFFMKFGFKKRGLEMFLDL